MGADVQLAVVDACPDLVDDSELQGLHAIDQRLETGVIVGIGTGNVRGVAMHLGARVDQKRANGRRRLPLEVRVVKHGPVLIESDDVAVRQFRVGVTHRGAVGAMNVELRLPVAECSLRHTVAGDAAVRSEAHHGQFVLGFCAARVMQGVDRRRRIDALDAERHGFNVEFANCDALLPVRRDMGCDIISCTDDADIEMTRPVAFGRAGYDVPVIVRLVVDQYWRLARRVDDVRVRQLAQRYPAHEVRVRLEGVVVVIEEHPLRIARKDDGVAGTGPFERRVVA